MVYKIGNIFGIYKQKGVTTFEFRFYAKHSHILWRFQPCSLLIVSLHS